MNNKEIAEFVKSRDEAFVSFVQTDSLAKFFKHCAKYGIELPENSDVMKAGILKAVQECTNIPKHIKMLAAEKCIRLGFKPFIDWDDVDADEVTDENAR